MKQELRAEILSELEEIGKIEIGTNEYKIAVDGVYKLADKLNQMEELEIKKQELANDQYLKECEIELKTSELENDKKDRFVRNLITVVTVGAPLAVTIWGTYVTLNFEKEGTVTTIPGRNFINKLFKK